MKKGEDELGRGSGESGKGSVMGKKRKGGRGKGREGVWWGR